ncbi:MAG: hypothetical protein GY838_00385 [bacterium]|nr:hypothetical protein [bacterium]
MILLLLLAPITLFAGSPDAGLFVPVPDAGLLPDGVALPQPERLPLQKSVIPSSPAADRLWTVLYYDDADFSPGGTGFDMFLDDARSTATIDILILLDTYTDPAVLYHVGTDGTPVVLEAWGEVDMGDPATLQRFIEYGKTHYPAQRYLVSAYDHGSHYAGACIDQNSGTGATTLLTWKDWRSAITAAGGVDLLAFTAPCTTTPMEGMYDLGDAVDYVIASEELSFLAIWWGVLDDIFAMLSDEPDVTNAEAAARMVELVAGNTEWFDADKTMAAIGPGLAHGIVEPLDRLAEYLAINMETMHATLVQVRADCFELANHHYADYTAVDLVSWLETLAAALPGDSFVQDRVTEALAAHDAAVVANRTGANKTEEHGISIHYPQTEAALSQYYLNWDLGWLEDTFWDEFLLSFYAGTSVGTEDRPDQDDGSVPTVFATRLLGNRPNPFNPGTTVAFETATSGAVDLAVHDLAGRLVRILVSGEDLAAGRHERFWDGLDAQGRPAATGVYLVRLRTDRLEQRGRMTLVK